MSTKKNLQLIYHRLFDHYGPQYWWPAEEPFEVIVGAILTQSTAWGNVEKAINNLKKRRVLNPITIRELPIEELASLIYPSGYYNAKARKLKAFVERLSEGYDNSLQKLFDLDIAQLRSELLSIYGIGQETADSIILYAAQKPIFVIDAYTHRIMDRLGLHAGKTSYAALQSLFMGNLPQEEKIFNEYHALLVRLGKEACRRQPFCHDCCLQSICKYESAAPKTIVSK
jgi:endonuclease III related protein